MVFPERPRTWSFEAFPGVVLTVLLLVGTNSSWLNPRQSVTCLPLVVSVHEARLVLGLKAERHKAGQAGATWWLAHRSPELLVWIWADKHWHYLVLFGGEEVDDRLAPL